MPLPTKLRHTHSNRACWRKENLSYRSVLADRYPSEKAEEIAKLMTSGTWTHDYPITCDRAQALGLPVNSNIPENLLRLMELYPQPMRRQPSVEYVPVPYRSDRHPAPS